MSFLNYSAEDYGAKVRKAGNKYRNVRKRGYQSTKEANRAVELHLAEKAGAIRGLREQVRYEIIPKQVDESGKCIERAAHYTADFVYERDGKTVVEDTKSPPTRKLADYVLRRKLMLSVHGIRLLET